MKLLNANQIQNGPHWMYSPDFKEANLVEVHDNYDGGKRVFYIGNEMEDYVHGTELELNMFVEVEMPEITPEMLVDFQPAKLPDPDHVQYNQLNKGCKFPDFIEGYWRAHAHERASYETDEQANYPWPVPMFVEGFEPDAFLKKLKLLEKVADKKEYRGVSKHRLTDEMNGNAEFSFNGWRWPQGYKAYIEKGVPPSRAFYKFVMNEELEALPTYGR